LGEETKTEIRGSDGSKFEEESMWQGKTKVIKDANGQKIYIYVPTNYNEAHGAEQYVQVIGVKK
jgi:hypothetical protein